MAKFKYALFYDFHTLATIPDVGAKFNVEAFTDQVKSCGVDFLTFHARCNQGNAYYNTKIGTRHPSLKYDLIDKLGKSCAKKGIRLSLYFNGHLSEEETFAHLDWADLPFSPELRKDKADPFYHQVCYNSPFREHMRDMVLELIKNYKFDGFFFDCLGASDCVCPRCVKEMQEKGIDFTKLEEVLKFSAFSVHRMCVLLNDEIRKEKPDALLFFNGRPFEEVIGMESHLECECLPTAGSGYDCLPSYAHYMRTVAGPEKSVLNMTGRFNNWGDFGGLRTAEGLEFDLFYGAANGMRPDIGGHYHPRGDIDLPVFDRIREVYQNMQQYDEWVIDAENDNDVALVYPRIERYYALANIGCRAAVRMLDELKLQFDFVSEYSSWDKYKLLIFPDDAPFSPEMTKRVEAHLKRGGAVLATSKSGLDKEGKKFTVSSWPVVYEGPIGHDPFFFQPAGKYAEGLPDMPLDLYASGSKVKAVKGAKVEMVCVKPYMNYGWDGFRGNYYIPPQGQTDEPFLVEKGNIIYIAGELFAGYHKRAPKQLRELLGKVMGKLDPSPKLKTENLPSFARAIVQKKGRKIETVHLLAYCPERRCEAMCVEDRISVLNTKLALRTDGKKIRKVYLAPERKALPFELKDGYCHVTLDVFTGYTLVVFES